MLPATPKVSIPASWVRRHHVYLADHEWQSNTDMRKVAEDHINEHGPKDPYSVLVVTVHEHAGWHLSYARVNGTVRVVGSANDRAEYPIEVEAVRVVLGSLPTMPEDRTTFRRG